MLQDQFLTMVLLKIKSFEMLQSVGSIVVTVVSKVPESFMLMVKQSESKLLALLDPEDDNIMILLIFGKPLPMQRAYHLRRLEISYGYYTFNSETQSTAAWPHLYGL